MAWWRETGRLLMEKPKAMQHWEKAWFVGEPRDLDLVNELLAEGQKGSEAKEEILGLVKFYTSVVCDEMLARRRAFVSA